MAGNNNENNQTQQNSNGNARPQSQNNVSQTVSNIPGMRNQTEPRATNEVKMTKEERLELAEKNLAHLESLTTGSYADRADREKVKENMKGEIERLKRDIEADKNRDPEAEKAEKERREQEFKKQQEDFAAFRKQEDARLKAEALKAQASANTNQATGFKIPGMSNQPDPKITEALKLTKEERLQNAERELANLEGRQPKNYAERKDIENLKNIYKNNIERLKADIEAEKKPTEDVKEEQKPIEDVKEEPKLTEERYKELGERMRAAFGTDGEDEKEEQKSEPETDKQTLDEQMERVRIETEAVNTTESTANNAGDNTADNAGANNEEADWLAQREEQLARLAREASERAQNYKEPNLKVEAEKKSEETAPKKNFFDMDEDEEQELAEPENTEPSKNSTITPERYNDLGERFKELFGAEEDEEEFEIGNKKPEPVTEKLTLEEQRERVHLETAGDIFNPSATRPVERENPFKVEVPETKRRASRSKASAPKERITAESVKQEFSGDNMIVEAHEDDEVDAVYTVENDPQKADGASRIRIGDFHQRLDRLLKDDALSGQVRAQTANILSEAGAKGADKDSAIVFTTHKYISEAFRNVPELGVEKTKMSKIAVQYFNDAYEVIESANLSDKNRIIAAQRIADLMIKNYSPVAFVKDELDTYADNYVIKDENLLKMQLAETNLSAEQIEKLVNDIKESPEFEIVKEEPAPQKVEEPKEDPAARQARDPEFINVPEFYAQLKTRVNVEAVTKQVKEEISNILKESGIEKVADANDAAHDSLDIVELIEDLHEPNGLPEGAYHTMHDIAKMVFVEAYETIERRELTPRNKIITAQRVSDVILKNYSPVTFAEGGALDGYADNYVIGKKSILRSCMRSLKLPEKDILAVQDRDLMAELAQELEAGKSYWQQQQERSDWFRERDAELARLAAEASERAQNYIKREEQSKAKEEPKPEEQSKPKEEPKPEEQPKTEALEVTGEKIVAAEKPEEKVSETSRVAVFQNQVAAFDKMYKVKLNSNNIARYVTDAWKYMKSGDETKKAHGKQIMQRLFQFTLQPAFNVEKNASYNEHRLPAYDEIIKGANEMMRAAMFAFTDLYHDPKSAALFAETGFGGMSAKEMAELTAGDSQWKMDQKSDEAWEIQSREAKELVTSWQSEKNPYDKMLKEMNSLIDAKENGILNPKDMYTKLTAAEWMLTNDARMMVYNYEDPINPIPNWGNRYWKALTNAREALGISKHTSMRELIQSDYAAMAKAVVSPSYNEKQIADNVLDPDVREVYDSLEAQKELFTTQSRDAVIKNPPQEVATVDGKPLDNDPNKMRWQICIKTEDERENMKNAPKVFLNIVADKSANVTIEREGGATK